MNKIKALMYKLYYKIFYPKMYKKIKNNNDFIY
jgi:hypothetical protein